MEAHPDPAGGVALPPADESNARNCYCRPGETTCGTCEVCGAAGHTRHYPGMRPYTGAWCDRCYAVEAGETWPVRIVTGVIWLTIALLLARCVM